MNTDSRLPSQRSSAFGRAPFYFASVLLLLAGCGRSPQPIAIVFVASPSPIPALLSTQPTPTPIPALPSPQPTPTPIPTRTPTPSATPAGWETIAEGAQIRRMVGFEGERGGYVFALRLDPARVDIQLRHDPDRPRRVAEWFAAERPLAALNAGFFARDGTPVGLWVIDDAIYGRRHRRMQGEFRVTDAGVSILRVSERYLTGGTRIIASVESYPLLLLPGGAINPCLRQADRFERLGRPCARSTQPAERVVVGIDGAGHLVFLLLPSPTFTLRGLADWLGHSDLNLHIALNLDGGSSAGMLVQAGERVWGQNSGRDVPGAIIVFPKILSADTGASP